MKTQDPDQELEDTIKAIERIEVILKQLCNKREDLLNTINTCRIKLKKKRNGTKSSKASK